MNMMDPKNIYSRCYLLNNNYYIHRMHMGPTTSPTGKQETMFVIMGKKDGFKFRIDNDEQFDSMNVPGKTSIAPKEFIDLCNKYNSGELKPTESQFEYFSRVRQTPEKLEECSKCHNHPEVYKQYLKRIKSMEI